MFAEKGDEEVMDDDSVVFHRAIFQRSPPERHTVTITLILNNGRFQSNQYFISPLILFLRTVFKHKIIQLNCRGLKPNYNEVSLLISEYNPSVSMYFVFKGHSLNQMITSR